MAKRPANKPMPTAGSASRRASPWASAWPAKRIAQSAGASVSDTKAEIAVLAAIVRANCR